MNDEIKRNTLMFLRRFKSSNSFHKLTELISDLSMTGTKVTNYQVCQLIKASRLDFLCRPNKLECYITLSWKVLSGTNTLG